MRSALLICGILAALVYIAADVTGSLLYPNYSFNDQAVSELFAIGAPTSNLIVPLFTCSSALLAVFSFGVGWSAGSSRPLRLMALAILLCALDGLLLWNFFPMHMRGAARTFTDTMHLILAANPFVIMSLVCGIIAFRSSFRFYTSMTLVVLLVPAIFAFQYAPAVDADLPTPGIGLAERVAQYAYQLWQVSLALTLIRLPGRSLPRGTDLAASGEKWRHRESQIDTPDAVP
jgi:hypothetical membrane protein